MHVYFYMINKITGSQILICKLAAREAKKIHEEKLKKLSIQYHTLSYKFFTITFLSLLCLVYMCWNHIAQILSFYRPGKNDHNFNCMWRFDYGCTYVTQKLPSPYVAVFQIIFCSCSIELVLLLYISKGFKKHCKRNQSLKILIKNLALNEWAARGTFSRHREAQ